MSSRQLRICFSVWGALILLSGCRDRSQHIELGKDAPQGSRVEGDSAVWRSQHFPVEFSWRPPWRYMKTTDAIDSPERLRAPFREPETEAFLVAEITPDVSTEQLRDATYFSAVKEQQLQVTGMELIDEGQTKLFGMDFYRLRFSNEGEKGPRAIHAFIRRDGKTSITLQTIFPVANREAAKVDLPEQFELLEIKVDSPN